MQYVIKQISSEGSMYWDADDAEYTDDIDCATHYDSLALIEEERKSMSTTEAYNTVVIPLDTP